MGAVEAGALMMGALTRGRATVLLLAALGAADGALAGNAAAAPAAGAGALAGAGAYADASVYAAAAARVDASGNARGASVPAALTGNVEAGRAEFARCQWCHQAGPSARSGFGPQLTGIVGRRAGAATDYRYSAAMRNSGVVWSEPMLAAFIKAPQKVIPDNKMRFWGIADEQRIAHLLAYLRTL